MSSPRWILLGLLSLLPLSRPLTADDYTFELPDLVGSYLGDSSIDQPPKAVSADLGMPFVQIDEASLRLTGTLTTGTYGDLNSPEFDPLSAVIRASFDGPDIYSDVTVDQFLEPADGPFQFEASFGVGPFGTGPDFSSWLDGTAAFDFVVYPPFLIGTTYVTDLPAVTIESATLLIRGQPRSGPYFGGSDLDGDGDSDGSDFLAWQRSHGDSGLLPPFSVEVPEPRTLLIAAGMWTMLLLLRHRVRLDARIRTRATAR